MSAGFIPSGTIGQVYRQRIFETPMTEDAVDNALLGPNGVRAPTSAQIQILLGQTQGVVNLLQGQDEADVNVEVNLGGQDLVGTLDGLIQFGGVLGSAAALGLNPQFMDGLVEAQLGVDISEGFTGLEGGSFDLLPTFTHEINTDLSIYRFPLDLDQDDGVHLGLSFKKYQKDTPTQDPTFDDDAAVFLPIPMELVESYSVTFSEFSPGPLRATIIAGLTAADNAFKGGKGLYGSIVSSLNAMGQNVHDSLTSQAGAGSSVVNALRSAAFYNIGGINDLAAGIPGGGVQTLNNYFGNIINPATTVSMTGVPLRTHVFTWLFAPKSKEESDMLMSIRDYVKASMLPTKGQNGLLLEYPLVCVPKLFPNELYKFKPCFVTDIQFNHAGGGTPAFFYDDDKNPVIIACRIVMKELEIFVNDSSDDGSSGSDQQGGTGDGSGTQGDDGNVLGGDGSDSGFDDGGQTFGGPGS